MILFGSLSLSGAKILACCLSSSGPQVSEAFEHTFTYNLRQVETPLQAPVTEMSFLNKIFVIREATAFACVDLQQVRITPLRGKEELM